MTGEGVSEDGVNGCALRHECFHLDEAGIGIPWQLVGNHTGECDKGSCLLTQHFTKLEKRRGRQRGGGGEGRGEEGEGEGKSILYNYIHIQ